MNVFREDVLSMGIKACNKFANEVRRVEEIRQFKKGLNCYELLQTFCSVDEYR
jgi:hypothetical protein